MILPGQYAFSKVDCSKVQNVMYGKIFCSMRTKKTSINTVNLN